MLRSQQTVEDKADMPADVKNVTKKKFTFTRLFKDEIVVRECM